MFMSVDPGSHATALIVWEGGRPKAWLLAQPGAKVPLEERLRIIITAFRSFGQAHQVELVAIEKPFQNPERPAYELQVTYKRLCRVAKDEGWKVYEYRNSTVVSMVAPRGFPAKTTEQRKRAVKAGVLGEYGDRVKGLGAMDNENLYDAVGVGICHLSKLRERELTL